MRLINKTRFALLGMLLESPRTGYEIKSFMERSTNYFWRESDSTIYPMLKKLAKEGKVRSKTAFVGKKKKEIFSITKSGKEEFKAWLKSPTGTGTPRSEFLLKLFFIQDHEEMKRLFFERLEQVKQTYEEYRTIRARLEKQEDSFLKAIRLKSLKYGMSQLKVEIKWLKEGIEDAYC